MTDKQKALQLHESGLSYSQIAKALGIGKTTAYQFVKEARQKGQQTETSNTKPVVSHFNDAQTDGYQKSEDEKTTSLGMLGSGKQSLPFQETVARPMRKSIFGDVPFGTQAVLQNRTPANSSFHTSQHDAPNSLKSVLQIPQSEVAGSIEIKPEKVQIQRAAANHSKPPASVAPVAPNAEAKEVRKAPRLKEFTGDELIAKQFQSLPFTGKFLELIGKPSKIFAGIVWGLPKGGKSNLAIRFADYLQEYFGQVVYVAAEEGESVTLQEKFKEIGGSKVLVVEARDREEIREYLAKKKCDFVFIDSINTAGIDNEFLELLKTESPDKSFIAIVQATKGGNFKGDQALTHNCDFIIKVVGGIAYHQGRFAVASEISIFEEPLYEKNPNPQNKPGDTSLQKKNNGTGEVAHTSAIVSPENEALPFVAGNGDTLQSKSESPRPVEVVDATPVNGFVQSPEQATATVFVPGDARNSFFGNVEKLSVLQPSPQRSKKSAGRGVDIGWGTALLIIGGAVTARVIVVYYEEEAKKKEQKKKAAELEARRRQLAAQQRAMLNRQGQMAQLALKGPPKPNQGRATPTAGIVRQAGQVRQQTSPANQQSAQPKIMQSNATVYRQVNPVAQPKRHPSYDSDEEDYRNWPDCFDGQIL